MAGVRTGSGMPSGARGSELRDEFHRQVENLMLKGYPELAGLETDVFVQQIAPLEEGLLQLRLSGKERRVPFVIAVKSEVVASERSMPLVELGGKQGFTRMEADELERFTPIENVEIPDGPAYLVADIDTGRDTLNVTPDEAMRTIVGENRSPLTIAEGVALITHYPEVLKTHNCFSILGSRCGDRRVTAMWISGGSPRLGWCWAGTPHTWLGSASCASRFGD